MLKLFTNKILVGKSPTFAQILNQGRPEGPSQWQRWHRLPKAGPGEEVEQINPGYAQQTAETELPLVNQKGQLVATGDSPYKQAYQSAFDSYPELLLTQLQKQQPENICQPPAKFCPHNLGIPREQMPQLDSGFEIRAINPQTGQEEKADWAETPQEAQNKTAKLQAKGWQVTKQIPHHEKENFMAALDKRGIKHRVRTIPAVALKASQNVIHAKKIDKQLGIQPAEQPAKTAQTQEQPPVQNQETPQPQQPSPEQIKDPTAWVNADPIPVSSDLYIVDGHHRWATMLAYNYLSGKKTPLSMNVTMIDAPIKDLIKIGNEVTAKHEAKSNRKIHSG